MERDALVRAVCEWLVHHGVMAEGIEFRFGGDVVQILRDGTLLLTFAPSALM